MASTPVLGLAAGDSRIYKDLDLQTHTFSWLAFINHFRDLMDRCLASGNIQAHYVQGIHEYFCNNTINGMHHLRVSAGGSYADGVIMLCRGERAVGHAYIYMLGWRESPTKLDECWRRIKTSLHGIVVARLPVYMTTYQETRAAITSLCQRNLRKLEPPERCHVNDMDNYCELCLCYK